jgi:hypothetical protein
VNRFHVAVFPQDIGIAPKSELLFAVCPLEPLNLREPNRKVV